MTRTAIIVPIAAAAILAAMPSFADKGGPPHGHDKSAFSAGEPGDPKKPAKPVQIVAVEKDGKMIYIPDRIEVRQGEQIKFIVRNVGDTDHEFVLATTEENLKHAEEMKKNPDMEHDDANAKRIAPKKVVEIVWKFTKAGEFEYGCLIPGHREAGMIGRITVK